MTDKIHRDAPSMCANCENYKHYEQGQRWAYCEWWHKDKQPEDICENYAHSKKTTN